MELVMEHRRPQLFFLIILIGGSLIGGWYLLQGRNGSRGNALQASGTVEAVEVEVAAELGGVVLEVMVAEADRVEAGQVLVRLDDRMLQAQFDQAEAVLAAAQASYDLAQANAEQADVRQQAMITAARFELISAQQALDTLYESAAMQAAQAQLALAQAQDALDNAEYRWRVQQPGSRAGGDIINAAEANLILVDQEVERAQKEFNKYAGRDEDDPVRALALSNLSAVRQKRDAILRQLNWYKGEPDVIEQAVLDAEVAFSMAQVEDASRVWGDHQDGPDPDDVALLDERLVNARAQLAAAQADNPTVEQLAVAAAQIAAAQANLKIIQVQLEKTVIQAPVAGVVLSRNVERGEMVVPGVTIVVIGELDALTITVFVPEDRYGQIDLGQLAEVQTDSFPGEIFSSTVVRIADQAEFTPRNVQTAEGRRTTVFAVQLAVDDPLSRLKPGMPADVTFSR
jgi:HlyD family secretion protein